MIRAALLSALVLCFVSPATAAIHVFATGTDDDNFNGLLAGGQGTPVGAGVLDPLPTLAGSITDQGDFKTTGSASSVKLTFNFPGIDTSAFLSITSAQVTFKAASIGVSGAFTADGFGLADVSFEGNSLGKLNTPLVGSPEIVQEFNFNVTPFVGIGNLGTLQFIVDGTTAGIAGNDDVDGIKVEYALLWIDGDVVPEPTSLAVWSSLGALGLMFGRRRR